MINELFFFAGIIMFVCGPFLGVWAYHEGVEGPVAFVGSMLCTCLGFGLMTGAML